MATIGTYNFPNHKKGDTFNGIQFTVNVNALPSDLTGADIKMELRNKNCIAVLGFSTGNGRITITDAVNGVFQINSGIIDIPVDTYNYDIQITYPVNIVKTYIEGTWKIVKEYTRG